MAAGEVAAVCSRLPSVRPAALASPRATSAATCVECVEIICS